MDNLEKLYSDLDQDFAANLAEVVSNSKHDSGSLVNLMLLAMTLKWRTPASDEEFNRLKHSTTMADLGIRIVPKDPSKVLEPEVLQRLIDSDLSKEGKRTLLPIQPFLNADKTSNEAKLIELHDSSYLHRCPDARDPALLSDCGIIEQSKVAYDQLGNFIFPLSSMLTLICKKNPRPYVEDLARFYSCGEMITLFFAKRYVSCANKEHLQTLISHYNLVKSQPDSEEYLLIALLKPFNRVNPIAIASNNKFN